MFRLLGAILLLPRWGDILLQIGHQQHLRAAFLLLKSQRWVKSGHCQKWKKKKKSNCMDFLAVANLAIKVQYPLSDSGGVSAVSTHISQRPRLTGCSYRENVMEQMFGSWIALPCECGGHPYCHNITRNCYWKMTCKQTVSSNVWLSVLRILGKYCFFEEGRVSTESVFSGLYLWRTVLILTREPSSLPREPNFQSQGSVFPAL